MTSEWIDGSMESAVEVVVGRDSSGEAGIVDVPAGVVAVAGVACSRLSIAVPVDRLNIVGGIGRDRLVSVLGNSALLLSTFRPYPDSDRNVVVASVEVAVADFAPIAGRSSDSGGDDVECRTDFLASVIREYFLKRH